MGNRGKCELPPHYLSIIENSFVSHQEINRLAFINSQGRYIHVTVKGNNVSLDISMCRVTFNRP
uniref:Putative ovule protein n=1 Tax=Solanum chacoense TaxID=4108 RepID=A0A0V0GZ27_SOLCH